MNVLYHDGQSTYIVEIDSDNYALVNTGYATVTRSHFLESFLRMAPYVEFTGEVSPALAKDLDIIINNEVTVLDLAPVDWEALERETQKSLKGDSL